MCDEAQFYTPAQVEQLARVVDELNADVHALGLLTDFRGRLFEGSARFLELADERQELQVEARCWCGARATQNARVVNGQQVYDGEVVMVGDTGGDAEVTYELLCRRHWLSGETGRVDEAAAAALVDERLRPSGCRPLRCSAWRLRSVALSSMPQGEPWSVSRSRNGVAGKASGPSTPVPVHVPLASSSRAITGLMAVCQTTAWLPSRAMVSSLSARW